MESHLHSYPEPTGSQLPTFSAVVVTHANEAGLRKMLGNLMYQTVKPTETIVVASDTNLAGCREHFPWVMFHEMPNQNDWGHAKRAKGLALATSDYVGFFNDDDSYSLDYIGKMLRMAQHRDACAVYCNWNEDQNCNFHMGSSTAGNFIVKRALAQPIGWPTHRYEADGDFINAVAEAAMKIAKVNDILYNHNA